MCVAAKETTDITLFVRTSHEEIVRWDRRRIVDALMLETDVDAGTAEAISLDVEKQIMASGLTHLTAPLIRELVDAKLMERGLEQARSMHMRLGFPLYDVSQLILHRNKENANLPHGPEASNLILAEGIKKEYALHAVFSPEVGDAHARGDIHLHDLGYVDRPYSSSQTLEFVKKFGISLPNTFSASKPARHAEVLLAHMVRYSAVLQGCFSGTIGWDAVNVFFAPYLADLSDRDIEQLAQMLVFEFSQLAVSRGGQAIFTEIGIAWEVPRHLRGVPAIGPGGSSRAGRTGITRRTPSGSPGPCLKSTGAGMPSGARSSSRSPCCGSPRTSSGRPATRNSSCTSAAWPPRREIPISSSTAAEPTRSCAAAAWTSRTTASPGRTPSSPGRCGTPPSRT